MEIMLFNHEKFDRLYNCSFYNATTIPLEERTHRFWGVVFIIEYVFFMTLYCACMYAMFNSAHRHQASYKLMMLLGCIHITGLQVCSLSHGLLAIKGAVFCTNPVWTYTSGAIAVGTWCASTLTSMILGFNRCCELYGGGLGDRLFGGYLLYIWMAFPVTYMLYYFLFTLPPIFNGPMMALFFNPHHMYYDDPDGRYTAAEWATNNIIVCSTESFLYGTLIMLYIRATRVANDNIKQKFKREKRIYIQVILIGLIHFNASFVYLLMQFIPVNFYTTLVGHSLYIASQGCPSLIYLFVNRSIQNTLLTKIGQKKAVILSSSGAQNSNLSNLSNKVTPNQPLTFSHNLGSSDAQQSTNSQGQSQTQDQGQEQTPA